MKRSSPAQFTIRGRRGAVILIAMIALVVATSLALTITSAAFQQRKQGQRELLSLQATWLAESALDRAAAALAADPAYNGETWNIFADELGGRAATVEIRIDRGDSVVATAIARYPAQSDQRVQVTKTIPLGPNQPPTPDDNPPDGSETP